MFSTKEFTTKERFVFAAADLWGGGGQTIISVLYLVYLTNVLGVRPGVAASALLIAKIWDAVIDPFLGVIGDNTRSKWGRRRPYLVFGGGILFLAMAVLWLPLRQESQFAQGAFIVMSNILYATIASLLAIAYSAMSTEISTDFDEVNKVNVTRLIFSMTATAICTILPTIFFKQLQDQKITVEQFYSIIVFGFGLIFVIPIIIAGLYCRERVPYDNKKVKMSPLALVEPLRVKPFRQLVALYLTQTVTMDTVSSIIIYYGLYVVKGLNTTVFLGIFLAIQLVMLPIFNQLVKTISKTKLYRIGLPVSILAALGIGLYPSGWPVIGVYILTAVTALGYAGAMTLSWIIFPDVVDIAELIENKRSTGSFSATMTFIRQISSALTIFLIGNMLEVTGFINPDKVGGVVEQPAATVLAIRLIFVITFFLLGVNGWRVARKLNLTPEKSKRVKYFLIQRAKVEGNLENVPTTVIEQVDERLQEQAELQAIIKEYR